MLYILVIFYLMADNTDHLIKGQISDESVCLLCGDRFLCGASEETLSMEILNNKKTARINRFCAQKNHSYLKELKNIDNMPWVPESLKSFKKLKKRIDTIVDKKSSSKFTGKRIAGISDDGIEKRIIYRLLNGVKYQDIKNVTDTEDLKNNNYIFPLFSQENFIQSLGMTKEDYKDYLENLISAPRHTLLQRDSGYVSLQESSSSRQPANAAIVVVDRTDKKNSDFYAKSGVDSFLKKILYYPNEFCKKLNYRKTLHANHLSLKSIAKNYGGLSQFEQNYYYNKLIRDFRKVEHANKNSSCNKEMQSFLHTSLLNLPNVELKNKVEALLKNDGDRGVSSKKGELPANCKLNINNYNVECN